MQTVNFQCGHCGKLMAVGRENLGQQVRCPHCQQVVLAPSSEAPAPAPEPAPSPFGNLTEHEDIFTQKSETDDVLFGQHDAPRLEVPREPEPTFSANGPSGPDLQPISQPAPAPDPALVSPPLFVNEPPPPSPSEPMPWSPAASSSAAVQEEPAFVAPRQARERKESFVSPMFLLLVYTPTLLWALGATAIGYWLYTKAVEQNAKQNDPFEKMIDDGDDAGVKKKGRVRHKMQTTEKFATAPLPEHLKVKLGEPVVIGDLEVTPVVVSRKRVKLMVEGFSKPEPCEYDSLVLNLKFKNVSTGYAFAPLDNYFDRKYKGIGPAPLTLLQAGDRTFFGGCHEWVPLTRSAGAKTYRQWPEGRKNTDPVGLRPGEDAIGFVCTDGKDERTAEYLFGSEDGRKKPYHGPLLWRVQVRRGPHEHKGRMLSATAVIGVEFTDKDYLN